MRKEITKVKIEREPVGWFVQIRRGWRGEDKRWHSYTRFYHHVSWARVMVFINASPDLIVQFSSALTRHGG